MGLSMFLDISILFIFAKEEQEVFIQINEWFQDLLVVLFFQQHSLPFENDNFAQLVDCFEIQAKFVLV